MLTATMRVKELFFDAPAVRRAMDDASHKALSRIGAFLRTRARGSMREAKGPSRPGKPPHAHVGTIKRLLFFSYDRATRSVVVGPV
ncbi:MAG TPA: hypothetical protein VMW52_11920, partial [Phycisphaerae bacterium]|nr:hypothetical protein [Phycisphaerae bacterium]